ncbi:MAG: transglycosylase SLT domain-containing protein [Thermoanaerobaculia bacterium]
MRRSAVLALAAFVLFACGLFADVARVEVSGDLDAEFARAADLLEEGERADAEGILDAIRRKAALPAWDARAALLLADDDSRRGDFAAAASRLEKAPASSIGLDAYRRLQHAEALELAGRPDDALEPARRAFEAEGPFAFRVHASSVLARLLEKRRDYRQAADVLARASHVAGSPGENAQLAIARIRLGLATGDAASVESAARDLLLDAPTYDANRSTPGFARRAAARAESSLSPAERGRRGAALVDAGDGRRGVNLLSRDPPAVWPEGERGRNLLALARGQLALKKSKLAEETAARISDDGTLVAWEARLFRCSLVLGRLRAGSRAPLSPEDPRLEPVRRALEVLTAPAVPLSVRRAARERLLRFRADGGDFEGALAQARELTREDPDGVDGFEPLWLLAWERYRMRDFPGARSRFEALAELYRDISRSRRLEYWRARCLETEGRAAEARPVLAKLAAAAPPDLYARFARTRVQTPARLERDVLRDPSTTTAAFSRVDELLRLRMFEEASAEARRLLPSRGRDLRLAQSDFALGRFLGAASAIKRALPQIGTAEEGRVPDAWRRLYYPIEEGTFLAEGATEFSLDAAVLRGLVRQESVFDANAKSRAGAMGLTQLMPATAKSLARSVLRSRYRRAFLYDPGVNARLGAAYLRRLLDRFDGSTLLALAAYNGGPTRIARVLRENPSLPEDELFESIPLFETRDYVRRVVLYAESYRELYP